MSAEIIVDGKDGWRIYKTPGKYYKIFAYNRDLELMSNPDNLSVRTKYWGKDCGNEICEYSKMHVGNNINDILRRQYADCPISRAFRFHVSEKNRLSVYVKRTPPSFEIKLIAAIFLIKLNETGLSNVKVKLFNGKELIRLDFKDEEEIAQFNFYFYKYFS